MSWLRLRNAAPRAAFLGLTDSGTGVQLTATPSGNISTLLRLAAEHLLW
jgi:hypothetical protein